MEQLFISDDLGEDGVLSQKWKREFDPCSAQSKPQHYCNINSLDVNNEHLLVNTSTVFPHRDKLFLSTRFLFLIRQVAAVHAWAALHHDSLSFLYYMSLFADMGALITRICFQSGWTLQDF